MVGEIPGVDEDIRLKILEKLFIEALPHLLEVLKKQLESKKIRAVRQHMEDLKLPAECFGWQELKSDWCIE